LGVASGWGEFRTAVSFQDLLTEVEDENKRVGFICGPDDVVILSHLRARRNILQADSDHCPRPEVYGLCVRCYGEWQGVGSPVNILTAGAGALTGRMRRNAPDG